MPKPLKIMVWGVLGAPGGGLGECLGAIWAPRAEKVANKWVVGPPPPSKLEPKIVMLAFLKAIWSIKVSLLVVFLGVLVS